MSTIENAKKVMGWVNPNARPACGNCAHVQQHDLPRRGTMYCGKGGFYTNRFAICDKHTPMMLTTGSAPK